MSTGSATADGPITGSRLGLTRERILAAALDLVDREGLEAFSMRRLGQELGVGTMTLYGYFRSRDAILDAVIDAGAEELARSTAASDGGGTWRSRLRALMIALRQGHLEHPAIVELRFKRPLLSPGALKVTEVGLRTLRDAGFTNRQATEIYRVLFIYTFGFSAFGPGREGAADRDKTTEALAALPTDEYPTLVDAAREASATMADPKLYERGLDALLDGFERQLNGSAAAD